MSQDRSIATAAEALAGPGHLFVLLGKIGNVVADAAVIPTDRLLTVEPQWEHVTGRSPADMHRDWKPADWEATGYSSAPVGEEYWFLDVTNEHDDDDTAQSRLRALLQRVAGALTGGESKSPGRIRPLVLVPVVGVGAGGMDGQTGAVVQQL
ncbi:hypothetical protein GC722_00345 [Auraticoccus sp. F435]|uniref:Uncharacterized protein n=1 Tax=Auraticoccus cholistanensis TaxID=2656650 RepID=A0A6A9UP95_9ACTN|nr:hypothetical protein [Auraticoccus cholistanensis]MVA74491.1 hypothetical protein [Auraticoccus cholistanensis]